MFADTAKLVVNLSLAGNFSKQMKGAQGALSKFDSAVDRSGTRAYKAGQQIGHGIQNGLKLAAVAIAGIGGLLVLSAKEGEDALKTQQLYAQAIQNSGKVSADYVKKLNEQQTAIMNLAGVDDELVKKQQTTLITMGLTGEQIAKLTPLIFDAAKATGKPVETITLAVGKAALGNATALQKLGIIVPKATKNAKSAALAALELQKAELKVTEQRAKARGALTKEQKDAFARKKALLDAKIGTQKLADARLKATKATDAAADVEAELARRFKDANKAVSGDFSVRLDVLRQALGNLRENAGIKILPVLTKMVDLVSLKLVPAFSEFLDVILPPTIDGLNDLLSKVSSGDFNSTVSSIFATIKEVAPAIQRSAEITGEVIGTAVTLFRSLPPEIQSLAIAGLAVNKLTGGLVTNIAGGLISAVISSFRGLMNVNAAVVNVTGPVAGVPGAGVPGAATGAGLLGTLAGIAVPVTVAAIASAAAADLSNSFLTSKGFEATLKPAGLGLFGIEGSISAIQTGIALLLGQKDTPKSTPFFPTRNAEGGAASTGNWVRPITQAVNRGADATTRAIKDQDLGVTVNNTTKVKVDLNGRLVGAGLEKNTTTVGPTIGGSRIGSAFT